MTVSKGSSSRASGSVVDGTLVAEDNLISNSSNDSSRVFGRSSDENELSPSAGGGVRGDHGGDHATSDTNNENMNNNKHKQNKTIFRFHA